MAGKTLAGLNVATSRANSREDEHAVFLSGDGPLVQVLREALAQDQAVRKSIKKKVALRKVESFVQNIHHFRDEALKTAEPPAEKVVIFDEVKRAWDKAKAADFMQRKRGVEGFYMSEPALLVNVMDRHTDWCMLVCLIGGGQEINTDEAGLAARLGVMGTRLVEWDGCAHFESIRRSGLCLGHSDSGYVQDRPR